jgi:hypothetical protein
MARVYAVIVDSREDAAAALDEMCAALGLEPDGVLRDLIREGKWMARAVPARRRPDDDEPEPTNA